MRHALGALRWKAISAIHRRELRLPDAEPRVSFTFDDFPRSAYLAGGAILRSYDVFGTYYAAMGLMDKHNDLGEQFCREDMESLLRDGHELGSHTFSHLSGRAVPVAEFQSDVAKGRRAVENVTCSLAQHSFSYPYGHATLGAKKRVGACFSSCRGIVPGINASPVDLNLLRANSLYNGSFDVGAIGRFFDANEKCRGWLIFYTHDVSEKPSAFGCTPLQLDGVVKLAVKRRARVVSMGWNGGTTNQ